MHTLTFVKLKSFLFIFFIDFLIISAELIYLDIDE